MMKITEAREIATAIENDMFKGTREDKATAFQQLDSYRAGSNKYYHLQEDRRLAGIIVNSLK